MHFSWLSRKGITGTIASPYNLLSRLKSFIRKQFVETYHGIRCVRLKDMHTSQGIYIDSWAKYFASMYIRLNDFYYILLRLSPIFSLNFERSIQCYEIGISVLWRLILKTKGPRTLTVTGYQRLYTDLLSKGSCLHINSPIIEIIKINNSREKSIIISSYNSN